MKGKVFALVALIILLGLAWFLVWSGSGVAPAQGGRDISLQRGADPQPHAEDAQPAEQARAVVPAIIRGESAAGLQSGWEEALRKAYETPMDFFGLVLDERDEPVEGATVVFSWNPIEGDTVEKSTASGPDGRFELYGARGFSLGVDVKKDGYYQVMGGTGSRRNVDFYSPTGAQHYSGSLSSPTVFHLRKKGSGGKLVRNYLDIDLPPAGHLKIDLDTGVVAESGEFEFALTRSTAHRPFAWEATARIANGGFVKIEEQFPFEAPEAGYQEEVKWTFPLDRDGKQPKNDLQESYYVTFGIPKKYARLRIWVKADTGVIIVEEYMNPHGERTLEPE